MMFSALFILMAAHPTMAQQHRVSVSYAGHVEIFEVGLVSAVSQQRFSESDNRWCSFTVRCCREDLVFGAGDFWEFRGRGTSSIRSSYQETAC
jgi:hypothetical protein